MELEFMFAQLDQAQAVQDYPPFRPCLRLIGVDERSFQNEAFNSERGCNTYFIDIAWQHLFDVSVRGGYVDSGPFWELPFSMPFNLLENWPDRSWVRLAYRRAGTQGRAEGEATGAYYYEIFGEEDEATDITVESFEFVSGTPVTPAPQSTTVPTVTQAQTFNLSAFHVGQGMCALLHGNAEGFLFDAGAGMPVRRSIYRRALRVPTTSFRNDLRTTTAHLALQAVISHSDSDHWRLLDWDRHLVAATSAIFTPAGTAALGLKSPHVIGKVFSLAGTTVVSNGGSTLFEAHRSSPSHSDSNGECLVVETYSGAGGRYRSLLPGDYVYSRMATDSTAAIKALSSASLDAVMVPHHGDNPSATVLVSPNRPGSTVAFFSAGTHPVYLHPTPASLQAHQNRQFLNVDNHTCADIIEYPLP